MVVIEDSRQQAYKHKSAHKFFRENGITMLRSKLLVGDYQIASKGDVVVDTKKDVLELFMDLTRDHARFRRECKTAQDAGIQLIILIEEELPNGSLLQWKSPVFKSNTDKHRAGEPRTIFDPAIARKVMITMTEKYGVKFRFCSKQDSGRYIIDYLTGAKK